MSSKPAERNPRGHLALLCGLLCDGRVWAPVAGRLEPVVDTHIHSFAGCTGIGEMADQVLSRAPQRFALAGHSMGARVALEVYRKAPGRVQRLALLNTGVHPVKESEVGARQRLLDIAEAGGMAAVADDWLPPMVGARGQRDHALMRSLREMVCGYSREAFTGQVRALLERPDAQSVLTAVGVPALFLCSEEDRWSPVAQHEAMQRAVPGSRLVVIRDAGHMSIVESPQAVAAALQGWLADKESSCDG